MSKIHIAPNRVQIDAEILTREVYKVDPSYFIVQLLVLKSNTVIGYERMKGAEQGCSIDVLISKQDWNLNAYSIGDIISFELQKVSMKLWRLIS